MAANSVEGIKRNLCLVHFGSETSIGYQVASGVILTICTASSDSTLQFVVFEDEPPLEDVRLIASTNRPGHSASVHLIAVPREGLLSKVATTIPAFASASVYWLEEAPQQHSMGAQGQIATIEQRIYFQLRHGSIPASPLGGAPVFIDGELIGLLDPAGYVPTASSSAADLYPILSFSEIMVQPELLAPLRAAGIGISDLPESQPTPEEALPEEPSVTTDVSLGHVDPTQVKLPEEQLTSGIVAERSPRGIWVPLGPPPRTFPIGPNSPNSYWAAALGILLIVAGTVGRLILM